jgi:transcriptional regulator with XRE-family HTH domain
VKQGSGRLKLTQERFARIVGIDQKTVSRYALGERRVPRIVEILLTFAMNEPNAFAEVVKARELLDDEH